MGQVDYYVDAVAKGVEDYYTGAGEAPGEWMGRGAARLGLTGEVAAQDLRTILGGEDPVTGARLAGRPGHERVPGWDLTFSAPKSVSVLYALADGAIAGAVVDAHRAAVEAGIAYLEDHATVSRRRAGGVIEEVRGEGLVVGAFRHRTSRAGDPHLHTHALAANAVDRVDGGWGAMHSPHLYRHARSAGFTYQSVLRSELTERLGVQWGRVENGYAEIDGIDAQLLEQFSKRRAEIEAALAERGEDSAAAAQVAVFDTRGRQGGRGRADVAGPVGGRSRRRRVPPRRPGRGHGTPGARGQRSPGQRDARRHHRNHGLAGGSHRDPGQLRAA